MTRREFNTKKRNIATRKPRPVVFIVAEGKNVTESQYFRSFQQQFGSYTIKIAKLGNITDPEGMHKKALGLWSQNELKYDQGDRIFIVLDLDCDEKKAQIIKRLARDSKQVEFIVSNPCFEVWFLLHFRYSTKPYQNSMEVVYELQSLFPEYEKNYDMSSVLGKKLDAAMKNAQKLKENYDKLQFNWPSNECNPRTDVPQIIKVINNASYA